MRTPAEIIRYCQRNIEERAESLAFDHNSSQRVIRLVAETHAFERVIEFIGRDAILQPDVLVVDLDLDPLEAL